MARPTTVTFDVYGTLARWDETVHAVLGEVLAGHGRAGTDIGRAADAFEAESRRLQTVGAFRSYRGILRDSLAPAFATAGLPASASDADVVLDRLSRIPPFVDVPPVLARLAQDFRLAPISNSDDDFLAGTLNGLGAAFDTTVTAEQALAYKPNPGLFRFALQKLETSPSDLVHVAQGTFSDLAPCTALGLRVVWVNRTGATLQRGLEPMAVIDDLSALPAILASL